MADAKDAVLGKSKQNKHNKSGDRRTKRAPPRPVKSKNTILVHRKSDFKTQLERCQRLLDKGEDELQIHGLGAAINRSINMALQLQLRAKGTLKLITTTSTVDLVDDFEPVHEEIDPYAKSRSCSAIHIILRKIAIEKLIAEKTK
ncbi:ribonuclease P protein subunit p20-like [Rhopilema esculentum]|uniref:ribonuclease P protein subunit p20-like n=1 Tax=Rhopilema esculentum TaxID=499914 RepID=UPI0031D901B2